MSNLAVIDIGSNSLKVSVIARSSGQEIAREHEFVRLFPADGHEVVLAPATMEAAIQAVARLLLVAQSHQAAPIILLGTSALRECTNRSEFDAKLRQTTGHGLTLISGEVEARLAADGIRSDPALASYQHLFAFDLGGGSLEVMEMRGQRCTLARSYPLGSVRLTHSLLAGAREPINEAAQLAFRFELVKELCNVIPSRIAEKALIVGVGGAFATIASYLEAIGEPPVAGALPLLRIRELKDKICRLSANQRVNLPGIPANRLDIMPAALITLCVLAELTGASAFTLTHCGVRHGMVKLLMTENGGLIA